MTRLARLLRQTWCGLIHGHPIEKSFRLFIGEGLHRVTCDRCGASRVVHG